MSALSGELRRAPKSCRGGQNEERREGGKKERVRGISMARGGGLDGLESARRRDGVAACSPASSELLGSAGEEDDKVAVGWARGTVSWACGLAGWASFFFFLFFCYFFLFSFSVICFASNKIPRHFMKS